jgi:spore germination protein GerM
MNKVLTKCGLNTPGLSSRVNIPNLNKLVEMLLQHAMVQHMFQEDKYHSAFFKTETQEEQQKANQSYN